MIKNIDLNSVRLFDFTAKMKNIQAHLALENLSELGLETIENEFSTTLSELEKAIKPVAKNDNTAQLAKLDNARDMALVGFIKFCEAYKNFPNQEKEKAGMKLLAIARKYGKSPQRKPFNEETILINSLLEDLSSTENAQYLNLIGATEWIEALTKSNVEFARVHNIRTNEYAEKEVGMSKNARNQMYMTFKKLVQTINAMAFLQGIQKYQRLINNINQELE